MAIAINKPVAVNKPNPAVQPQQQMSVLQKQTAQLQTTGKKLEQKTQVLNQPVSLTLSKEGQKLAQNAPAVAAGEVKTGKPVKTEIKPVGNTGASYAAAVGAAATRTTAVKSQLEALQIKQSNPGNAASEGTQKGNSIM